MHPPIRALTLFALLLFGLAACSDDGGNGEAADGTTTTEAEATPLPDACELIPDAAGVTGLTLSEGVSQGDDTRSSCAFPAEGESVPLTFAVQNGDRFQELADLAAGSLGDGQELDGLGQQALFFYSTEDLPQGSGGLLVDVGDGLTITTTLQNMPEEDLQAASEALARHAMENLESAG
jgi:hypothetical protein